MRRVIYSAPDGDFSVIEVDFRIPTRAGRPRVILGPPLTVVGALAGLQPGEALRVVGRWEHHSQHGRQLRAELTLPIGPQTLHGIERYLTTLSGLGPELSSRIVRQFGLDSLTVLENETYRIAGLKGVGKRRAQRAFADARARRQEREVMIFLQGWASRPPTPRASAGVRRPGRAARQRRSLWPGPRRQRHRLCHRRSHRPRAGVALTSPLRGGRTAPCAGASHRRWSLLPAAG